MKLISLNVLFSAVFVLSTSCSQDNNNSKSLQSDATGIPNTGEQETNPNEIEERTNSKQSEIKLTIDQITEIINKREKISCSEGTTFFDITEQDNKLIVTCTSNSLISNSLNISLKNNSILYDYFLKIIPLDSEGLCGYFGTKEQQYKKATVSERDKELLDNGNSNLTTGQNTEFVNFQCELIKEENETQEPDEVQPL